MFHKYVDVSYNMNFGNLEYFIFAKLSVERQFLKSYLSWVIKIKMIWFVVLENYNLPILHKFY